MTKEKITVAVIGKSGQAAKIIDIVKQMPEIDLKYVYYPKPVPNSPLPITNDFNKILTVRAIIIASPTDTHAGYLRKLHDYSGYIFVEKPAVSTNEETKKLKKCPISWQKRIKINFNFEHSEIAKILASLTNSREIGQPIFLNIYTSHGLAFSEKYHNSWRANSARSFGVLEMVGIHFINLALNLFGTIKNFQVDVMWKAKKEKKMPPDTVFLSLDMAKGVRVNLYHSYAGPAFTHILMMGTNGYFEYDGKTANLYSPRNSYDVNGFFISPPIIKTYQLDWTSLWQKSLKDSLVDFFSTIRKKGDFSLSRLKTGLAAMAPIFFLRNNLK